MIKYNNNRNNIKPFIHTNNTINIRVSKYVKMVYITVLRCFIAFLMLIILCTIKLCYYMKNYHSTFAPSYYNKIVYKTYYEPATCFIGSNKTLNDPTQIMGVTIVSRNNSIYVNKTLQCVSDKKYHMFIPTHDYCNDIAFTYLQCENLTLPAKSFPCLIPQNHGYMDSHILIHKINFAEDIDNDFVFYSELNYIFGFCNLFILISLLLIYLYLNRSTYPNTTAGFNMINHIYDSENIYSVCRNKRDWKQYVRPRRVKYVSLHADTQCLMTLEPIEPNQAYYKCKHCVCVTDYKMMEQYWINYNKLCIHCRTPINRLIKYINRNKPPKQDTNKPRTNKITC